MLAPLWEAWKPFGSIWKALKGIWQRAGFKARIQRISEQSQENRTGSSGWVLRRFAGPIINQLTMDNASSSFSHTVLGLVILTFLDTGYSDVFSPWL